MEDKLKLTAERLRNATIELRWDASAQQWLASAARPGSKKVCVEGPDPLLVMQALVTAIDPYNTLGLRGLWEIKI